MTSDVLKCGALIIALLAPVESFADPLGSLDDNTSPPSIIVPPTTLPPQTPPSPPSPIGANILPSVTPLFQTRQFQATGNSHR